MNVFKKLLGEDVDDELDNDYVEEEEENVSSHSSSSRPVLRTEKPKPEFVLEKPTGRDELLGIADHLLRRKTVILNLELVSKDTKRFVDFLSGVAYALAGQVKKVADDTFLIIPGGVEITGNIFDEMDNDNEY